MFQWLEHRATSLRSGCSCFLFFGFFFLGGGGAASIDRAAIELAAILGAWAKGKQPPRRLPNQAWQVRAPVPPPLLSCHTLHTLNKHCQEYEQTSILFLTNGHQNAIYSLPYCTVIRISIEKPQFHLSISVVKDETTGTCVLLIKYNVFLKKVFFTGVNEKCTDQSLIRD